MNLNKTAVSVTFYTIAAGVVVLFFALIFAAFNAIRVGYATSTGKIELARAEHNRHIATLEAQVEVARAHGVAEVNKIISDGLGGSDAYLRYLQIEALKNTSGTVIYVPTEAGLPVTETNRLREVTP